MSGIEIVGLLLGVFPLAISAMEHYEEMSKVAGTFWKIRRAHKKDLGKIKDCRLMFRLNMKELLTPLLTDEIVDKAEYEQLLADPGGALWESKHVSTALEERLDEYHERYVETLQEMQETMAALCNACLVNDDKFQKSLNQKSKKAIMTSPANATNAPNVASIATQPSATQAQDALLVKANMYVCFQAKRAKYAMNPTKREDLLAELEGHNRKLETVLAASDRVSDLTQQRTRTHKASISPKTLKFWRHANDIYSLLRRTWHCTCQSCASLWLQQQTERLPQMSVVLPFCHGRRAVHIEMTETLPTLQIPPRLAGPAGVTSVAIQTRQSTTAVRTVGNQRTVTVTTQSAAVVASTTNPTSPISGIPALQRDGLCRLLSGMAVTKDPVGRISEGDSEYAIFPAVETVSCAQGTSLADILRPDASLRLTRVQRYGIALTLASSHLQLHSTPWLKAHWTAEDVLFPTTKDNNVVTLHGEPYILTTISPSSSSTTPAQEDLSFSTLGIVLLELCFGYRLEEHKMWTSNPAYAALKTDPNIRQVVACQWAKEVLGEAGEGYADAVHWTLTQSPAVLKDERWREEFAGHVVQPLKTYFDVLHPTR